jgi:hypothetical protein
VTFRKTSGYANDFETAIAQVVNFLRDEGEDAIRKSLVGGNQRGELFEPENFSGRQSVTAVRCPQSTVIAARLAVADCPARLRFDFFLEVAMAGDSTP